MSSLPDILLALLGFNALVVIHELGHYLVARACGMRVLKFSIGLGPAILRVTGRHTVFQVAAFPLGGFVQIAGMSGRDPDDGPGSYLRAKPWQRAAMVAAGPLFNLVAALVIYLYLVGTLGALTTPAVGSNVVRDVDGPAAAAGLRPGDAIVALDGEPVTSRDDVNRLLGQAQRNPQTTTPVTLTVVRPPADAGPRFDYEESDRLPGLWRAVPRFDTAWERLELEVTPERLSAGRVRLGVIYDLVTFGAREPARIVAFAFEKVWFYTETGTRLIARMLVGKEAPEISSVVKITQFGSDTLRLGGSSWFLNFLAMLSVSLCLLNLIPFPPLDGGRLVFISIEAIFRRPVPVRVQNIVQGAGIVLLLGLIGFVTARDVVNLF